MDKNSFIHIVINLLEEGKTTELLAHGISMFPFLLPGDRLKISPKQDFTTGDIVIFKGTETLVAHRIVKMESENIICKGDSLYLSDPVLLKQNILGVVVGRTRNNSYRSGSHWKYKLAKKIMPTLGKYPRIFIRYTALAYLKMKKNSSPQNNI
ncbi:S24/S26 family peptidase [Carboxylicivirga linearis]|uniref:S24/S26 family peptidase n=1 Tax=Carboxylicivirga linearis TaxID=1628157 RepID=A0ABS5JZB9_9BACT|nr:S24/S26 family peptidase [Carboxylicivirga linearis]MBS2100245.1 S24/S26 family peptidase [Carboxylicivirga linearis]